MKQLRDMRVYASPVKDIKHVAIVREVQIALITWIKSKVGPHAPGVLIGGLAMSFYARPRSTTDVDLLFLSPSEVPLQWDGFKRTRPGAFQEKQTHVEIEVTTPQSFHIPLDIVRKVIDTAINHDGMRVASREGMVALKLVAAQEKGRRLKDLADVVELVRGHPTLSMHDWPLTIVQQDDLQECHRMTEN